MQRPMVFLNLDTYLYGPWPRLCKFLAFSLNRLPVHGLILVDLGKGGLRPLVAAVGHELAVEVLGNVGKDTMNI